MLGFTELTASLSLSPLERGTERRLLHCLPYYKLDLAMGGPETRTSGPTQTPPCHTPHPLPHPPTTVFRRWLVGEGGVGGRQGG